MGNANNIKPLSQKLAKVILLGETIKDFDSSAVFDAKTKEQLLLDIRSGKHLSFINSIDTEKDWEILQNKIKGSKRKALYWKYAAAASVLLCVALAILLSKETVEAPTKEPIIVNNKIETGIDKATLTLNDGTQVLLEKGTSYQTTTAISNGETIIYTKQEPITDTAFNTLTIPRGGQFYIALSDGTEVWLNSESQLKYPESFSAGKARTVALVYGEAYFKVAPSTAHKGATFIVNNQFQDIEVLGTAFNIKAYKNENSVHTTLVEGKVAISTAKGKQNLIPTQQAVVNRMDNSITIATVDVYRETSWKEGVFSFRNKPLKEIMTVLSRWYNMEVVFENPKLEKEKFNGTLDKNQSIEEILSSIKNTNIIKTYEIKEHTLILK